MVRYILSVLGFLVIIINNLTIAQDTLLVQKYIDVLTITEDTLNNNNEKLNLNRAIILGLKNNPELKALNLEISAFQAKGMQAGLYPNPEIGVDLENIFGTNDYTAFNGSENTIYLSQNVILGGKLSKAKKVQLLNSNLAKWDVEINRLKLIKEIRKTFVEISSLQLQNQLNHKLLAISREFIENLQKRIHAGKASQAEEARASLISTALEIKIQETEMKLASEVAKLNTLLGIPSIEYSSIENNCYLNYDIPAYDSLKKLIIRSPHLAKYNSAINKLKAQEELEKSKVIPDLSLTFGFRKLNETSSSAFVLGASVPIPIFNNNKGNIQYTQIKQQQTAFSYRKELLRLEAKLQFLLNNIEAFQQSINKLLNASIPQAKEALKIISEGNMVGRFNVLDVLDAQKNLFYLESQFVDVVKQYNKNVIELENLTLTKFNYENKIRIEDNE